MQRPETTKKNRAEPKSRMSRKTIKNNKIKSIKVVFDPRPLLEKSEKKIGQ